MQVLTTKNAVGGLVRVPYRVQARSLSRCQPIRSDSWTPDRNRTTTSGQLINPIGEAPAIQYGEQMQWWERGQSNQLLIMSQRLQRTQYAVHRLRRGECAQIYA
ncbi:hypothetical protein D3C81_2032980 [compost metagenome]